MSFRACAANHGRLSPLRLEDRQIESLSCATPKRDCYCQSRRGNRLFDLGLSEVALAFAAASSKSNQAAITETGGVRRIFRAVSGYGSFEL
jgi:type IV secretory pathway VirB4 component